MIFFGLLCCFFGLLWLVESSSHKIKNRAEPSLLYSSHVESRVKLESGQLYRLVSSRVEPSRRTDPPLVWVSSVRYSFLKSPFYFENYFGIISYYFLVERWIMLTTSSKMFSKEITIFVSFCPKL